MTAFCGRKYDELTINKAIAKAVEEDKSVYLLGGNYRIDDFYDFGDGGPKAAITQNRLQLRRTAQLLPLLGRTDP